MNERKTIPMLNFAWRWEIIGASTEIISSMVLMMGLKNENITSDI